MAKREQLDRHACTRRDWTVKILGQIFAFALGLIGLCGGMFLVYAERATTGLCVFLSSLGALIGATIYQTRKTQLPPRAAPKE